MLIQPNLNDYSNKSDKIFQLLNNLNFLIVIIGDVIGTTLLKETTAVVWFCLVPSKFENCDVYFDFYKGDVNVNAVAKLNFVSVLSSGFSLLIYFKLNALSFVPIRQNAHLLPQNLFDIHNLLKVFWFTWPI